MVDTPEVSLAKAEHAAAHVNEKFNLARESIRSADFLVSPVAATVYSAGHAVLPVHAGTVLGVDGRVQDTPEVAIAKAQHAAAHIHEKLVHAHHGSADFLVAHPTFVY